MSGTAALVPSRNGRAYLERCLPNLCAQTLPFNDILVIDNGSSDGTAEWLKTAHPAIRLLELDENKGFSGGVNRGLAWVLKEQRYDCVAIINNDVYLEPGWHNYARQTLMSSPRLGACATCLVKERQPEQMDSGGIVWVRPGQAENYLSGRPAPSTDEPDREIFGASGAAGLFRTELFKEIGLFDEALFAYHEDVDLAIRAQAAGWHCMFTSRARGLHTGHGSNRAFPLNGTWSDYFNARNRLAVLVASLPGCEWRAHWRTILIGEITALFASVHEHRAAATFAGFARGLMRLPYLILKRYGKGEKNT